MSPFVCCFLISIGMSLIRAQLTKGDPHCPSSEWAFCSSSGQTCHIPASINQTVISYGAQNSKNLTQGQWSFTEISNTRHENFSIQCNSGNFVDAYNGAKQGCCYLPRSSNNNRLVRSLNEGNWKMLAFENEQLLVTSLSLIKYGAYDSDGGQWSYR